MRRFFYIFVVVLSLAFLPSLVSQASVTNGTIDATNKFARFLDSDFGPINFGTTNGSVAVTDSGLTGYAWNSQFGWINLAPTSGGVTNDGEGNLSGFAWGEITGWVNFNPTNADGVTIDSSGDFAGYAWSQNYGWIVFNCLTDSTCGTFDHKVSTDWRPASSRTACNNGADDDGDGLTDFPADPGCSSADDTDETNVPSGGGSGIVPQPPSPTVPPPTVPPPTEPPPTEPPPTEPPPTEPPPTEPPPTAPPPTAPPPTAPPSGVGGQIIEQISQIGSYTKEIAAAVVEQTKAIFESPTGSVVTKTITTAGVVTTGLITVSALFLNPLSITELVLIPFRLWVLLLSFLGLRKRYRPWGTVYDSITRQPIDPAYVSLQDMSGKEITSSITDLDGRYGFLAPPGTYRIVANKTNYLFPSKRLFGKNGDELYNNLYFGDPIVLGAGAEGIITRNIPMDPEKFDWNEFAKKNKKLMAFYSRLDPFISKATNILFVVGFFIALIAFFVAPAPYNIIIFVLYIVILLLRFIGLKPKNYGFISDRQTGEPLSFAIVRIFSPALGQEMAHRVCDRYGRFYVLVPKGEYYLKIERKNPDESYTLVHTSGTINASRGIINSRIKI